ncbi:MAG: GNAT family N-acetyltransferase [Desulfobaccales bacterium]
MPTYEVLSYSDPEQRQKWRDICQRFSGLDISYYPEYAYLFELNGDGKAHCYVYYESPIDIVLYPFLKRCINEIEIFADIPLNINDIITPYGFGGYFRTSDLVDMEKFYKSFQVYCRQNQIVSEFIRFNPILKNQSYSPKDVQIRRRNETVVMDLTQPLDDLWMGMTPSCRNKVRKSRNYGVDIVIDQDASHLGTFYSIYCDTMERLGSPNYYYFLLTWFENMLTLLKGHAVLCHALYRNSTIMSAIFLFSKDIINYFLSGSIYEMRNSAANNLMLYEVALWAQKRGIKYFHLGGGYLPNDNLFKFKASFSPLHIPFYTGEAIHDQKLYRELNRRRWGPLGPKVTNFFPAYRIPVKDQSERTDPGTFWGRL